MSLIKVIIGKYAFYRYLDLYGFIFYWFGIVTLIIAYPIHCYMDTVLPNNSFIDRVASVALVFFLISEFRLASKTNLYILEAMQSDSSLKISGFIERINLNTNMIDMVMSALVNILTKLQSKKASNSKIKASLSKIQIEMNNMPEKIKSQIHDNARDKVIREEVIKQLEPIQVSIFILIAISTILWGFGSLI